MKRSSNAKTSRQAAAEHTIQCLQSGFYTNSINTQVDLIDMFRFSLQNARIVLEGQPIPIKPRPVPSTPPEVLFMTCSTLAAAELQSQDAQNLGILNFASAKNPGGGFRTGASAQEESLARSSALGLLLENAPTFYLQRNVPDEKKYMYTSNIVYSPRVPFFKRDDGTVLDEPYAAGVVTCAAVNYGVVAERQKHFLPLVEGKMEERIRRIAEMFDFNDHDVVILGAYGCGVFRNPVDMVTALFYRIFILENKYAFKKLVFAVIDSATRSVMEERWRLLCAEYEK
ncbi:hypothetical protein HDU67_008477 [Dinochytrium kinnereticum]|nr:hypothetical protein HDU67_008477 [Dinochytrium kinnereticum]